MFLFGVHPDFTHHHPLLGYTEGEADSAGDIEPRPGFPPGDVPPSNLLSSMSSLAARVSMVPIASSNVDLRAAISSWFASMASPIVKISLNMLFSNESIPFFTIASLTTPICCGRCAVSIFRCFLLSLAEPLSSKPDDTVGGLVSRFIWPIMESPLCEAPRLRILAPPESSVAERVRIVDSGELMVTTRLFGLVSPGSPSSRLAMPKSPLEAFAASMANLSWAAVSALTAAQPPLLLNDLASTPSDSAAISAWGSSCRVLMIFAAFSTPLAAAICEIRRLSISCSTGKDSAISKRTSLSRVTISA
mmetsp:Transcript_216/g.534  ORF Transcript_216/g.534 Transcript_216/m.534 type:complete len:305 (-) Transcript_216:2027-2941(-)